MCVCGTYNRAKTMQNICDLNPLSNCQKHSDGKYNVAQLMISVYNRILNIVGKKRKCWQPAFSPISTLFSKDFLKGNYTSEFHYNRLEHRSLSCIEILFTR